MNRDGKWGLKWFFAVCVLARAWAEGIFKTKSRVSGPFGAQGRLSSGLVVEWVAVVGAPKKRVCVCASV